MISVIAGTAGAAGAQLVDLPTWRQGPEHRAMKLQRELAADMRQDQSLLLGSHNSYNSAAYGVTNYVNSQHSYTLWEQLDLGLRSLDLDVHASILYPNELYLSHTTCQGAGINSGQLTLWDGLAEIRAWLDNNPDEVITLNIEQHFPMAFPSAYHTRLIDWVEDFLGGADPSNGPDVLIRPSEIPPENSIEHTTAENRAITVTSMTLSELRAMGRVLLVNTGGAESPCDGHYWLDYGQDIMLGDVPSFHWCGTGNWNYVYAKTFATDAEMQYWGGDPFGSRTRNCDDDFDNGGYRASRYSVLYNNTSAGQYRHYGSEPPSVVREAVRSGMDGIRFDPVGTSLGIPDGSPIVFDAAEQMRATIWSWDYRYLPPHGGQSLAAMAVIQGDTARIRWEVPTAEMRYALQNSDGQWSISPQRGTFAAAPSNFRVPGNGFEMQNLYGEMVRAGITKVWINYHDLDADGVWTHTTQNRRFLNAATIPLVSPVPFLVTSAVELFFVFSYWNVTPMPPTGRVLGVLPGSYPGSYTFSSPLTIVPAEHGHPVAIGRP